MGYQWNWGVFLSPSASGDDTYLGWMFAGFKMTIALSLERVGDGAVARRPGWGPAHRAEQDLGGLGDGLR
jgi:hypothetical protein